MNILLKFLSKFGFSSLGDAVKFGIQFIKFGLVGASNTIISYVAYYILLYFGVNYILSYAVGFVLGILNSYFWNSRYVFKKQKRGNFLPFIKMTAVNLLVMFLSLCTLYLMVNIIEISDKIAPLINLCILTPVNFFLNKLWAFK